MLFSGHDLSSSLLPLQEPRGKGCFSLDFLVCAKGVGRSAVTSRGSRQPGQDLPAETDSASCPPLLVQIILPSAHLFPTPWVCCYSALLLEALFGDCLN